MGTDIHGGFYKKNSDNSITPIKTTFKFNRHYLLFAILANVRNGFGFAGVKTFTPITPITSERGIPEELQKVIVEGEAPLYNCWYASEYANENEEEIGSWIGDHSFTWMTLKEILDWEHWDKREQIYGILDKDEYYRSIAQGNNPKYWCGGVSGTNVNIASCEEEFVKNPTKYSHINCNWVGDSYKEYCHEFLKEVERIKKEHNENIIFFCGFDS